MLYSILMILLEGDFLTLGALEAAALVPFEAAFDRGALVAVEPKERRRYALALKELIKEEGKVLLVAVEHNGFTKQRGPPYEARKERG